MKSLAVRSVFGVIALFVFGSAPVQAGSDQRDGKDVSKETAIVQESWCQPPPPFELQVGLPMWFAGLSGETGVKGVAAHIDFPFHKIFDKLTHVPIALSASVRYQRWEFFADGQYLVIGDSVATRDLFFTDASLHLKSGLLEAFAGYRLINCEKANLTVFTGLRYTYMEGNFSIVDNGDARLAILRQLLGLRQKLDFSDSTGWVDPVLGARGKVKFWKPISLWAEADVGGFDANAQSGFSIHRQGRGLGRDFDSNGSDWSYQAQGGVELQITRRMWAQLGWRWLKYDYRDAGFTNRTATSGPFAQAGITF